MKAYTSRHRFDERRRFNFVADEMNRVRLDADANEQALIQHTDAMRRSADTAEGSPDDGFLVSERHLADPVLGLNGWRTEGLPADDLRDITLELSLARREPECLPHVIRVRGATVLHRGFPTPLDLLSQAVPLSPDNAVFQAASVVLPLRFERPPTDDEIVEIRLLFVDEDGTAREVSGIDSSLQDGEWRDIIVPLSAFAAFPRSTDRNGIQQLLLQGWQLQGLPPRAELFVDALDVIDDDVPESDFILRGGDGSVAGAGRLFVHGRRTFIEHDWRYSLQPDLPNPPPMDRPADLSMRHLVYIEMFDRPVHDWEDEFLQEPALVGEPSSFRSRSVTQVRVVPLDAIASALPPAPNGNARLSTVIPAGLFPDRFPAEDPDPCRDRCLFSENVSSGAGYRGKINAHMRVEILHSGESLAAPVVAWARDNGATVAPLLEDGQSDAVSVVVSPEDAARFSVDDLVTVEDVWTRLDPNRDGHRPVLRRLRSADTATGRLEFFSEPLTLTEAPADLIVGGALGRTLTTARHAAVRRWDGADWLLPDIRYNLRDGIDFAFSGNDFRAGEYWSFTARIVDPDGGALGVVEQLDNSPIHGPERVSAPLALVEWTATSRNLIDLRARYLPLQVVRDRLIELGSRRLAPGAFTVVVGDGVRTFGDIDQNIAEGVTGDEAIQTALARLGNAGGTIYVRAGDYIFEHPVLLQGRSAVRILGDGAGTRLRVTGAGGAFHLDSCGKGGAVALEFMSLEETPTLDTPFGSAEPTDDFVPILDQPLLDIANPPRPLTITDLNSVANGAQGLLEALGTQLRTLPPGAGRIGASIVATLQRLRRLQRDNPGVPLEQSAPDELAVLLALPHGVITLCDSQNITLERLDIVSRAATTDNNAVAAAVLVTGICTNLSIRDNQLRASSGIVALPYARFLSALTLTLFPRAALFIRDLSISDNNFAPLQNASEGVRISDGIIDGLTLDANRIDGFTVGIAIEDRAETRPAGVDRFMVSNNQLVEIGEVGLSINGDGVDAAGNEIRLSNVNLPTTDGTVTQRVAVQVSGTGIRLRDNWIALPASSENRNPLTLEAGILVGQSVSGSTRRVTRTAADIEINDTRIEGAGALTMADGILVTGAQPVHELRISRNVIQSLGGAAIRLAGHAAPMGAMHLVGNRLSDVARASALWSGDTLRALANVEPRLSGIGLNPQQVGPDDVLARLLALDPSSSVALDAMLRTLDAMSLRGAIVLSLVDGVTIKGNSIAGVGVRNLPANFVDPGAPLQTAGILVVGGRDIRVTDNVVDDVIGVAQPIVFEPPVLPTPTRPPLLDLLGRYRLQPLTPAGTTALVSADSVYGSIAGLRRRAAEIAFAPLDQLTAGRAGMRLGADSIISTLNSAGGESAVAAMRMAEAIELVVSATEDSDSRIAIDTLRASLSDAASITAPDPNTAAFWSVMGAFDRALSGPVASVAEQAKVVASHVEALPENVRALAPDIDALVSFVIDAPDNIEQGRKLAATVGRLATGVTLTTPINPADELHVASNTARGNRSTLSADDIRSIRELTATIARTLTPADGATLAARVEAALPAMRGLLNLLDNSDVDGVNKLREAFGDLAAGRGQITRERLAAVRTMVSEVVASAIDAFSPVIDNGPGDTDTPESEDDELNDDVLEQERLETINLLSLAGKAVDIRLAEAAAIDPLDDVFELRVTEDATRQLLSLTGNDPEYREPVEDAANALAKALESGSVTERNHLREQARLSLDALVSNQSGQDPVAASIAPEKIAALSQLALEIGTIDNVELRIEAVNLFADNVDRIAQALALPSATLSDIRTGIGFVRDTLGGTSPSAATRDSAIARLASIASDLADAARRSQGAAPETETVATLSRMAFITLNNELSTDERIDSVRALSMDTLSTGLSATINSAANLADLSSAVAVGVADLTLIPPSIVLPTPQPAGFRLQPADGVHCAAVNDHLHLEGNHLERIRVGISVAGALTHPLVPELQSATIISVKRNRVSRAPIAAFDLQPDGSTALSVDDNSASRCAGVADPGATVYGQAIMVIVGRGELSVTGNNLRDNGNSAAVTMLHEILVDWRGDILLRGNRIRHAGGARGGCGLLLLCTNIEPALLSRLATEPALAVEPVPRPAQPPKTRPGDWLANIVDPSVFAFSLSQAATTERSGGMDFGAFELTDSATPILHAAIEAGPRPRPETTAATAAAQAWLAPRPIGPIDPGPLGIAGTLIPVIDFLDLIPPGVFILVPPARRSVQVAGNDVTAEGPALLLLNDGSSLVSVGVTQNEFESSALCGAVYIRQVDQAVFAANRCESLNEVNVAVLRCGRAAVSVSANSVVGRQRAVPSPKPLPRPKPTAPGGLTPGFAAAIPPSLTLNLGGAAGLSLPIRPEIFLDSLAAASDTGVYASAATTAASGYKLYAARNAIDPASRILSAGGLASTFHRMESDIATDVAGGATPSEARAIRAAAIDTSNPENQLSAVLIDPALTDASKLFAAANFVRFTDSQATNFVAQQLEEASGDTALALSRGISVLSGDGTAMAANVTSAAAPTAAFEQLLTAALKDRRPHEIFNPGDFHAPVPIPPPRVSARDRSLVIVGGSSVCAIGNATSAGVYVHPGPDRVLLNN